MMPTPYIVVCLPKLDDYTRPKASALAVKFRELRLLALQTDPESFASSYEVEVEADLQHTVERLRNDQANHFIAIESDFNSDEICLEDIIAARWTGMNVLIGPISGRISAKSNPLHQVESAVEPGRYHLSGIFVHPNTRRAGVGRALIEAALIRGREDTKSQGMPFHCTVFVDSANDSAQKLYESLGFRVTGEEETYFQQARSSSSHVAERVAIALELHDDL